MFFAQAAATAGVRSRRCLNWIINTGVELRNSRLEIHNFRLRLALALGFVLLMILVLLARFFYLQVIQHEHYNTLAEANRISIVPIAPNRGIIVDRNGVVLAHNYSAYTLEITPGRVEDLDALINDLATVIEITPKDRRRFKKLLEESKSLDSLPIRARLSDEEIARFAAARVLRLGASDALRREDARSGLALRHNVDKAFKRALGLEEEGKDGNYKVPTISAFTRGQL